MPPGALPQVEPLEGPAVFIQLVSGDRMVAAAASSTGSATPPRCRRSATASARRSSPTRRSTARTCASTRARPGPGIALQLARPLTEVDGALANLRLGLGLGSVAVILLAAFLARYATRHAVRPVTELTETAEHVARTRDLSRRIEAQGDDELARLAASFNTMLEALDDSQRAQRRLVADASHELRTPLTSLRTNLEVLGKPGALPEADRERLRADLVAQLEELSELVGDLVELARDGEPNGEPHEPLRLDELVAAAVERAQRHAPGVTFETELEPCVVDRRARTARPRGRQPARQRGEVVAAGRYRRGRAARRRAHRARPRPRHRDGRPPVRVRPLLPLRRPRAGGRLRASAWRSSGTWPRVTAARCTAEPAPGGGALLRLALPVSHPIPT